MTYTPAKVYYYHCCYATTTDFSFFLLGFFGPPRLWTENSRTKTYGFPVVFDTIYDFAESLSFAVSLVTPQYPVSNERTAYNRSFNTNTSSSRQSQFAHESISKIFFFPLRDCNTGTLQMFSQLSATITHWHSRARRKYRIRVVFSKIFVNKGKSARIKRVRPV